MKGKLSKVIAILVIFSTVLVLSYIYVIPYVLNEIERYTNPYGVVEKSPDAIETFTDDYAVESFDNKWRYNVLQGVVDSYGTKNGIDYVRVTYIDTKGKDQFANVMIRISEAELAKFANFKKIVEAEQISYKDLKVKHVSFYESDVKAADGSTLPTRMELEDFKNLFTKDTLLIFKIASMMPNFPDRTDDYCMKEIGPENCLYADMLEKFAPDWTDLWKSEKVKEDTILVPKTILSSFTEINEKSN